MFREKFWYVFVLDYILYRDVIVVFLLFWSFRFEGGFFDIDNGMKVLVYYMIVGCEVGGGVGRI